MIEYITQFIVVAIASLLTVYANNYFQSLRMNPLVALLLADLCGVAVFAFGQYTFVTVPLRIQIIRRYLHPHGGFEGEWVQTIDKNSVR